MTNRKIDIHKSNNLPLPSIKTMLINLAFGLVLGFLGPFGSYDMPILTRLIYWVVIFNLGYVIYYVAHKIYAWYFKDKQPHKIILYTVPSLLAAIPLSILVGYATELVSLQKFNALTMTLYLLPHVFIFGIVIDAIMGLINQKQDQKQQPAEKPTTTKPGQRFINRIPSKLGDDIIFFVMEDHYLLVYTAIGSHMILMRMSDALIELEDFAGMQVHRSYWVALSAVSGARKETRKSFLMMANGMEVPVSRKHLSKAKEAGLL